MARKLRLPVIGWSLERTLSVFVVVALFTAVIWRVPAIRRVVTGS